MKCITKLWPQVTKQIENESPWSAMCSDTNNFEFGVPSDREIERCYDPQIKRQVLDANLGRLVGW